MKWSNLKFINKKLDETVVNKISSFITNDLNQNAITISLENQSSIMKIFNLFKVKFLLSNKSSEKFDIIASYPSVSFKVTKETINYTKAKILPVRSKTVKGRLLTYLDIFVGLHSSLISLTITNKPLKFIPLIEKVNSTHYPFIFIYTSNPTLLFINVSNHPEYVVTIAEHNHKEIWAVKNTLFMCLPQRIAQPLLVEEYNGNYFIIEKGLHGLPWFQILHHAPINDLLGQSLSALKDFQLAVNKHQKWQKEINLKNELDKLFDDVDKSTKFDFSFLNDIRLKYLALLDETNFTGLATAQHSDFSVNNLLFENNHACIIDLEDFGRLMLPLQDEMSLAISFYLLEQRHSDLPKIIHTCLKSNRHYKDLATPIIKTLFLCQLLFKLGPWSKGQQRDELRFKIFNILKDFVEDENKYFN